MSNPPPTVAIIGAGLGGLTLALSLHRAHIPVRIYELRPSDYTPGGAIMLSPNALRILDTLGQYQHIKTLGFNFDTMTLKTDESLATIGKFYFGSKDKYEYGALRVYRRDILGALRKAVEDAGIVIEYKRRFSHVVSDSSEGGVMFEFAEDGRQGHADLLIGADGIHSKVRAHMYPDIEPKYSGFLGVNFAFPASKLRLPEGQEVEYTQGPVSLLNKTVGAFIMAPQSADGSEMFGGRQFPFTMEDTSRSAWDTLRRNETKLVSMLRSRMEQFSDVARSALELVGTKDSHDIGIWPFHGVPDMKSWASESGRVLMIGDAAHAIPPTAGQGANQAFEDALSLATVVRDAKGLIKGETWMESLRAWRDYRQTRITKVLELNKRMQDLRLSEQDRKASKVAEKSNDEKLGDEKLEDEKLEDEKPEDEKPVASEDWGLDWLYKHDVETRRDLTAGQL